VVERITYCPSLAKISFVLIAALGCGSAALASTITFIGTGTSTGGDSENSSALIVTGAGTISVTLNNLLSNPTDVAQNLSDLFLTLSNGATTGTLTTSRGTELTVNSNGTYSVGSSMWCLCASSSSVVQC
jgi:hypothetical protein